MKDLEIIFSGGLAIALLIMGIYFIFLLLFRGVLLLVQIVVFYIGFMIRISRENPYIKLHIETLIEKEHFNEYMEEVKKHEGHDLSV